MAEFNAYHQWLGIPLAEQPPHHYRLLGIAPFEDDPLVIEHGADRQMSHLRTFQTGAHSAASQKLLNEVAAARVCLLNAEKKAAYDAQLRQTLTAGLSPPPVPVAAPVDAELSRLFRTTEHDPSTVHTRVAPLRRRRESSRRTLVVGGIVLAGLAALGVFVWGEVGARRTPAPGEVGSASGSPATVPSPPQPSGPPPAPWFRPAVRRFTGSSRRFTRWHGTRHDAVARRGVSGDERCRAFGSSDAESARGEHLIALLRPAGVAVGV